MNTRVDRDDFNVCDPVAKKYNYKTAVIDHKNPPLSFCLHPIA